MSNKIQKESNIEHPASPLPAVANAHQLDVCAQEPIHIPGAIQPHGVLLALSEPELLIEQVSNNAAELLGAGPAELLGRPFLALLGPREQADLATALSAGNPGRESPLEFAVGGRTFDVLLHRHQEILIVELEPASPERGNFARHHRRLQEAISQMERAENPAALYEVIARSVSELTGFERVMVYRFDTDWHGETVAEALTAPVDSYMGLHFPASDIPEQARALYARSWLRIIPTISYTPAALEPPQHPRTGRPLDLSFAALRSVSPVHLEYLRNMDVGASMSISLIVDGRLWGLVACHHGSPRALPAPVRAACELFGQIASREIGGQQERRQLTNRAEVNRVQTRFFDVLAGEENAAEALLRYAPTLLELMNASGVAIAFGRQTSLVGQTPPRARVAALLEWLQRQIGTEAVLATDSILSLWPPAEDFKEAASGLLAVRLSRIEPHFVLWFRPEVVTTVTWAGNPEKPAEAGARIHPRKSFAAWKQTVAGHSLPWNEAEINAAQELRLAVNALVIRRTERLMRLNAELEQKNSDLNSFAYIASHDLKEPLRGIHHFSRFLREDHHAELGPEGIRKVDTITALATHTNELLGALAHFSHLGRMELSLRETDLDQLLDEVLATMTVTLQERGAEIRRPRKLPSRACDPVLLREVFMNLVANALKYNAQPAKWVEISWRETDPAEKDRGPIFCVRDNGIGIRERNLTNIFQMFRRLNKDKYGAGTGAGLAIVKSIVERHGGAIWAESTFGDGTTFCFTLQ